MNRDPEQLFIMNSITRKGVMESIQDIRESLDYKHPTGPQEITADDDRLTDEICQAYADAIGDIDPYDSEESINEAELNAARFALEAMGYEEIEEEHDESAELLREISFMENQLVLKRARFMQLDADASLRDVAESEPTNLG